MKLTSHRTAFVAHLLLPLLSVATGCGQSEQSPADAADPLANSTASTATSPGVMAPSAQSSSSPGGQTAAPSSTPLVPTSVVDTPTSTVTSPGDASSSAPTTGASALPTPSVDETPTASNVAEPPQSSTPASTESAATTGGTNGEAGGQMEPDEVAAGGAAGGAGGAENGGESTPGTTEPVLDIFMLMGQSNMAGVAKREASDENTDERLLVLGGCNQPAGQWNVAKPPLNDCPGEKGWNLSDTVDPGIWFGKTLLEKLPEGHTIGLVGTAESGESINTFISGGVHHQMILNKIAEAKTAENAHFAGIIFHQGESDSGQNTWPDKVVQLYQEVKEAFGVDYDVPFILGELPAGGCCSGHNTQVHAAAEKLPMGYWVSQDGTAVLDQYHFDHPSVVLMGQRYGESMIEALGW